MTWAISRDARLAELRALMAERAAVLGNLPPGTAAHGMTKEVNAIYAEIKDLEGSRGIDPRILLVLLGLVALFLWHLAS
ncbi:hypothetical protein [Kitasatospora sp. HPMI-4]|uniref:hypothetical protein n=1 Tax=Kitasatospora sp. HPMI-4 TaxID=3448443 RepID=UPI003F196397